MSSEQIAAVVEEIRQRVRSRYEKQVEGVTDFCLPSLTPLGQARDAAAGKVAAIGTVNPRPPGLFNSLAQGVKKMVARALYWHVREQIEFNRAAVEYMDRVLAALDEHNRHLLLAGRLAQEARQAAQDTARHFQEWRPGWEERWNKSEIQLLRSMAELQGAFHHRVTLMESSFREHERAQHADYLNALDRTTLEIQKQLSEDLARLHQQHERMIQTELRLIRQRVQAWLATQTAPAAAPTPAEFSAAPAASPAPLASSAAAFDYARFAERFRGDAAYVRAGQKFYLPYFQGRSRVLDLGCGRGEFLELMQENGVAARGIDCDAESIALCRQKQLDVEQADLFSYVAGLADSSLDGIFSAQVAEHLPPLRLPELIALAARKLEPGGVLAIETPNPECLAIFATNFYLDPTHVRPVPASLLHFFFEENGIGSIEVRQLAPAADVFPEIAALAGVDGLAAFQQRFFGGLDYAIIGRKL
ncbi:MAG TPA: class I SAM-dependent methyltransferase [Bryobacterales bacterium]|nr:class I SAM-dependent methyltransferase [Bryobacterales bacterium]